MATRLTVGVRDGVIVPDKALPRSATGLFAYVVQAYGTATDTTQPRDTGITGTAR